MGVKVTRSGMLDDIRRKVGAEPYRTVHVGVFDREVAEYATYVEYGWTQRTTRKQARYFQMLGIPCPPRAGGTLVMQPRPFLRATTLEKQKEWLALLGRVYANTHDATRSLALVGEQAAQDIRDTLVMGGTASKKFDKRKPMTMSLLELESRGKKASNGSVAVSNSNTEKPLVRTGLLLKSISYKIQK